MTLTVVFGIIGLLTISFAIWLKNDRRQDISYMGGVARLVYASASKMEFSLSFRLYLLCLH